MAWSLGENDDGTWDYAAFMSAYGCATGRVGTFPEALMRLAIAEADLIEEPYPADLVAALELEPALIMAINQVDLAEHVGTNIHPRDPELFLSRYCSPSGPVTAP